MKNYAISRNIYRAGLTTQAFNNRFNVMRMRQIGRTKVFSKYNFNFIAA